MDLEQARQVKKQCIETIHEMNEARRKTRDLLKDISSILIENDVWFEMNSSAGEIHLSADASIYVDDKGIFIDCVDLPSRSVTEYTWSTHDDNWRVSFADIVVAINEQY